MTLKELRKNKGLTQKKFAKVIGQRNTTVSMWETGNSKPRYETLAKIAKALGVSTDTVLDCFIEKE